MAGGLSRVGDDWEGYRVVETLGPRGMAERHVAVSPSGDKVLLDILAVHHPELIARLRMANLDHLVHPSLLPVRAVIQVLRFPALVLDYSSGVDLEAWLGGDPPLEDRLLVFRSIVEGLLVLHSRGLVHGNLQPDVILVEEDAASLRARVCLPGVASIVFGLMREGGSVTTSGAALGRPDYLAPERARTPEKSDSRADMFALGCLLYLLLAGRSPFAGLDRFAAFEAARDGRYVPLDEAVPGAPRDMVALCHKLLSPHPDDRIQHCGLLVDRLEASGVTSARREPRLEARRPVPLVPLVLAAAAAVTVLALLAWWWVG